MWTFRRFGLLVTGKGEARFMPILLRALTVNGDCTFEVIQKIEQLTPRTRTDQRRLVMVGSGQGLPTRDQEVGLAARGFLRKAENSFVILIDDLEHDRRSQHQAIFDRYRAALDGVVGDFRHRVSVHFMVNMVEAYYLANASAVNEVLGLALDDHVGDVEEIRHPKRELKALKPDFDEVADGEKIARRLDLEHVLANPATCASLRSLVRWCVLMNGCELTDRFRVRDGVISPVTDGQ